MDTGENHVQSYHKNSRLDSYHDRGRVKVSERNQNQSEMLSVRKSVMSRERKSESDCDHNVWECSLVGDDHDHDRDHDEDERRQKRLMKKIEEGRSQRQRMIAVES
jgi:hypothetical protein